MNQHQHQHHQHRARVPGTHPTRTTLLLVVLAVVVIYAVSLLTGNGSRESNHRELSRLSYPGYQVPQLELALLVARAPADGGFHRDPFSFAEVRSVTAPPSRPPRKVPRQNAEEPGPPASPPDVERLPSFPWAYLGYLGPETQRVAVFRGTDRQVEVAVVGHVVAGSFTLHRIGLESVEVAAIEHAGMLITVPLAKD